MFTPSNLSALLHPPGMSEHRMFFKEAFMDLRHPKYMFIVLNAIEIMNYYV